MSLHLRVFRISGISIILLGGCLYSVQEPADLAVRELANHPLDVHVPALPSSPTSLSQPPSSIGATSVDKLQALPQAKPATQTQSAKPPAAKQGLEERLKLSPTLPGGSSELALPPRGASAEEKQKALQAVYPSLPPLPAMLPPRPGPTGQPMTLAELQQMAMVGNPTIRQAASDVEGARGAARQAAAHPNPTVGYEADTIGTGRTAGQQGAYFTQLIKTAGKLKTAEASAIMSLLNAEVALRKAQVDVMGQVRANYFAVLVARESVRWNEELSAFTARVYGVYVEQTKAGLLAGYEPLLLRSLAAQAQTSVIQARQRYESAWRQLAAAIGQPDFPLTEIAGHAEMAIPAYSRDAALARVMTDHTDLFTAQNVQQKARYDLRAAQLVPVPDVNFQLVVQRDYTTPPFGTTANIQIGVPLPVWDKNLGGIQQAQASLLRASYEQARVRSDLSTRLADAYERYETNRLTVANYKDRVLPDLAKSYNAARSRALVTPSDIASTPVSSFEFIATEQLYINALTTYQTALANQWQAVVDVASLLQIDDLYQEIPPAHSAPQVPCLTR